MKGNGEKSEYYRVFHVPFFSADKTQGESESDKGGRQMYRILDILKGETGYISGEEIGRKLDVSLSLIHI